MDLHFIGFRGLYLGLYWFPIWISARCRSNRNLRFQRINKEAITSGLTLGTASRFLFVKRAVVKHSRAARSARVALYNRPAIPTTPRSVLQSLDRSRTGRNPTGREKTHKHINNSRHTLHRLFFFPFRPLVALKRMLPDVPFNLRAGCISPSNGVTLKSPGRGFHRHRTGRLGILETERDRH